MSFRLSNLISITVLAISLVVSFDTRAIPGQPGTLDATFGIGGTITLAVNHVGLGAAAIQTDGKIVLAAYCSVDDANSSLCVTRVNVDGTLDTTFGSAGTAIAQLTGPSHSGLAVAIQRDGKIVLAGSCNDVVRRNFCAARFNANGSIDPSFNGSGAVITSFATGTGTDNAWTLIIQPDDKLVLAGKCSGAAGFGPCILRYNTDGTIDEGFGNSGKVIAFQSIAGLAYGISSGIIEPDGKLVFAGMCGSTESFCAMRYLPNGSPDIGFGTNGIVLTSFVGRYSGANALIRQPDGKFVLSGLCYVDASASSFCALRYSPHGSVDTKFGANGWAVSNLAGTFDQAKAIAIQPDGKVLLAGSCNRPADFCLMRYQSDGILDSSFADNGRAITSLAEGNEGPASLLLLSDGKIVASGNCGVGNLAVLCLARYDGGPFGYKNCSLDIDGDNRVLATTDSLIHARIALGITGNAVTSGISFPPTATRNTWPLIRDHLVTQCGMSLVQ